MAVVSAEVKRVSNVLRRNTLDILCFPNINEVCIANLALRIFEMRDRMEVNE